MPRAEVDKIIAAPGRHRLGVLALSFHAAPLVTALAEAGDGIRINVVDSTNRTSPPSSWLLR